MIQAAVAAVLVVGLLAGGVILAWSTGSGPASSATLAPEAPPTPTPRILAFVIHTPEAEPTPASQAPQSEPETPAAETGGLVIVSTPEMKPFNAAAIAEPGHPGKVLHAATTADFRALAAGAWTVTADGLQTPGDQAVAAKWLTIASTPGPGFVVEAEMRVVSTLAAVCDQSFGIAGGSPRGEQVFGGGVIFPCDGQPQARITDVFTWEDGYNADAVLTSARFLPGEAWRTYRFELDGATLRLSVDGEALVETTLDPGINPNARDLEVGLWSQGVGVQVREITVSELA